MEENMVMDSVATENVQNAEPDKAGWIKEMKKAATKIGWKYFVFAIVVIVAQNLYAIGLYAIDFAFKTQLTMQPWANFLMIIIPTYCIGVPVLYLLVRKMPKVEIEKKKMGFWKIVAAVLIGCGICGIGMLVGNVVSELITRPFGVSAADNNSLSNLMMQSEAFWRILTVGILAPIFEELIFRKFLIDRVIKYGEFVAVLLSGLMFGLFHGNFAQFFFATGLGMLFAFIYARTGKVWYTILLHMVVNLSSAVITTPLAMKLMEHIDVVTKIEELFMVPNNTEALTNYMNQPQVLEATGVIFVYFFWLLFLGLCAITGIILFFVFLKKFRLNPMPMGVKKSTAFGKSFLNWGMILFVLSCVFLFVNYYVTMIQNVLMYQ